MCQGLPKELKLSIDGFENGFRRGHFFGFIARVGFELAGMALCYQAYSTCDGAFVVLEDLYVCKKFRGKYVGKELGVAVCKVGESQHLLFEFVNKHILGCTR